VKPSAINSLLASTPVDKQSSEFYVIYSAVQIPLGRPDPWKLFKISNMLKDLEIQMCNFPFKHVDLNFTRVNYHKLRSLKLPAAR
jgi:hypothetical protein